jgi:pilus assembly protein Flp/PilA
MALALLLAAGARADQAVSPRFPEQRKETRREAMSSISAFVRDESGATAIEYGLLAALISIAALASMKIVGTKLSSTFSKAAASLS